MIFFNRDISWIDFNSRVLYEGLREDIPVLERLKFLMIVSTNFDEFFQVRVASLKRMLASDKDAKDISGESISEILKKISVKTHSIIEKQYDALLNKINPTLCENGIRYVEPDDFSEDQEAFAQTFFTKEVFPLLTPLRVENGNFPHISNQSVNAFFKLRRIEGIHENGSIIKTEKNVDYSAIVQIPTSLNRILWLPSEGNTKSFTILDNLITSYGRQLFPGYDVENVLLFSVSRDADIGVNEEADNQFIEAMEEILADRQSSLPVRMMCRCKNKDSVCSLVSELTSLLQLTEDDVYVVKGLLHPESLEELCSIDTRDSAEGGNSNKADKNFLPQNWKSFFPHEIDPKKPLWPYLKTHDLILHLPYESFEPVSKMLEDAADDPRVLAIKMTLYRTESKSEIIKSLIHAAQNGKQVTAFVELKARFDEQRNIDWASKLEKAGVIVIYGIVNLKVHGKTMLIVRKEKDEVRRYVHLSTGNYNAKTALTYSDLSLFTSNPQIANDITLFFNTISGYSALQTMKHVYMAPVNLKSRLLTMIQRETERSTPENPGFIMAKMNSLGHEEIINALYKASQAGVKILLNVRGVCQLIPGVPGLSENIKVVSIVGHYLEHSRIFYFKNGGSEELYLSSADWMPRNLDRRVELMFPITDRACFEKVKKTLELYFEDNTHSHELLMSGEWKEPQLDCEKKVSVQQKLYEDFKKLDELNKMSKTDTKISFEIRRNKPAS